MFRTRDLRNVAYIAKTSQAKYYSVKRNNVNLDEIMRLNEELLTVAVREYKDFLVSTLASIEHMKFH